MKACESLTEGKKIREKVYGKQKVYVADQVKEKKIGVCHIHASTLSILSK